MSIELGPAMQDELIALGYMKPKTDAALAEKAAAKAAKARRRQGQEQRQAFRRFTTPGGLQVMSFAPISASQSWAAPRLLFGSCPGCAYLPACIVQPHGKPCAPTGSVRVKPSLCCRCWWGATTRRTTC